MARILFLSLVFPPDSVSTAQIMGDLAVDLHKIGHEVEVLTTTPHYNRDPEADSHQPRQKIWGSVLQKSIFHGIPVYHVIMPRKGSSIAARIPAWISFHILSTIVGALVVRKPQVIIVPSPPLTIALSAWILSLIRHAPFIYNVQEIYPDYAIELGAIQSKRLISFLYQLEALVYEKAGYVTVIASQMAQNLREKGVSEEKVKVIPNFVDVDDLQPLPKDNEFSRRYDIHNKFVVSYAGNMGPAQDLETFIEAARLLHQHSDIHFMMMGDGMLKEMLEHRLAALSLSNFLFLPYQPYSLVAQIYAASNLCLVPQKPGIASVAIPSKVYRIMACARPVLASTVPGSDLANLISEMGCGIIAEAGNPQKLADAIQSASQSPEKLTAMGKAGRFHVSQYYSRQTVSHQYHNLVLSLIDN
jgi:colanic acid biosynthesis glycosyl transferase WcaI